MSGREISETGHTKFNLSYPLAMDTTPIGDLDGGDEVTTPCPFTDHL
jgi:hypothetical protein